MADGEQQPPVEGGAASPAAPPADGGAAAVAAPPSERGAAPGGGGSQIGGGQQDASIAFVTKTYANYVQDIQQAAEGLRQRALVLQQEGPAQLQQLQSQIQPQTQEILSALQETQSPIGLPTSSVIEIFGWSSILLLASAIGGLVGGYLLSPIFGIFVGRAGAAILATLALPAVAAYQLNAEDGSSPNTRFQLLLLALGQGVLMGHSISQEFIFNFSTLKMVQESTMICVDNSEWMRNGDFQPTRLQSQQDAVNLVTQCKLRANSENAVGILSMANNVQVLSSLSTEIGRLMMKAHSIEPLGKCNFIAGLKIAHLALKHRQNRNHRMRIVLFIGSPLEEIDTAELVRIGKKMKKEKVLCDVVMFGDNDSDGHEKFSTFIDTLNGKEGTGSSLVVVPTGSSLTDALMQSSVCKNEDGQTAFGAGGGGIDNGFGMEVDNDPDLALALRVSMEEERARQAAAAAASGGAATDTGVEQESIPVSEIPFEEMDMGAMTEEQQLEWALRLSMQENAPSADQPQVQQEEQMEVDGSAGAGEDNLNDLMNNPELLQQIVDDLPSGNEKKEDKEKK